VIAALLALALAQAPAVEQPAPAEPSQPALVPADEPEAPVTRQELEELQDTVDRLRAQLEAVQQRQDIMSKVSIRFSGYLDFGFFWVQGNGSGVRPDYYRQAAPELNGQIPASWVLVGDPLSTAINSRGDVADTGDSRAIRSDPIHAGGRPSFLVNALNLGFTVSYDKSLSLTASLDFLPRDHDITAPVAIGDLFDLKLAFVRYELKTQLLNLMIDAGKVDSLLGIEYRTQDAPNRISVTPSLVCRYTCGRPLGVRAVTQFLNNRVEIALALTNGTQQVDYFTFTDQVDSNRWKTIAGRVAFRLPDGFELQVNGAVGPQDRQSDDSVIQWHAGAAAQLDVWKLHFVGEAVIGAAAGKGDVQSGVNVPCGLAPCLSYRAAYGLIAYRPIEMLQPYVRIDFRSARHRAGDDFEYISDVMRATLGINAHVGSHVIFKVEYTFNEELGPVHFPDDVFTSSLVVKY
jgi:hypothetical protein